MRVGSVHLQDAYEQDRERLDALTAGTPLISIQYAMGVTQGY